MSEYREQCNKRKDELHIKDPNLDQNCKAKRKRKAHKPVKVWCSPTAENMYRYMDKTWCFGRYETVEDAEKAVQQKMADSFYSKYYILRIEG